MRILPGALVALALALAAPLPAQTTLRLSAGATQSTRLVEDNLGGTIELTPAIAPTIALQVSHPAGRGYRVGIEARVASSALEVDDNGAADELGTLRTLEVMALLDGPIARDVHWHAGVGAILYQPSEETGIFSEGAPTRWQVGAGLTWSRPVSPSLTVVATGRYAFHPFTTRRLDTLNYGQFQAVHRVGLTLGVERSF